MQRSYGPDPRTCRTGCAVDGVGEVEEIRAVGFLRSAVAVGGHRRKPAVRRIDDERGLQGRLAALAPVRRWTGPGAPRRALRVDDGLRVDFLLPHASAPAAPRVPGASASLARRTAPAVRTACPACRWRATGPADPDRPMACGDRPRPAAAGCGGVRRAAGLSRRGRRANRQRAEKRGGEDDDVGLHGRIVPPGLCSVNYCRKVSAGPASYRLGGFHSGIVLSRLVSYHLVRRS